MSDTRTRFRRWRHTRPFGGGVCLLISAVFLGLPALSNFRIGDLILTVSTISGVSTVWLAVLMALCGVAALLWHHTRVVAGLSAMVIALVAFPAANFGGFVLGTLFGIVGASLVLAWRRLDDDVPAAGEASATAEPTDTEPADTEPADAVTEPLPPITDEPLAVVDESSTVVVESPAVVDEPTPVVDEPAAVTEALPPLEIRGAADVAPAIDPAPADQPAGGARAD